MSNTKKLTLGAVFIAMGILLPILFHLVGQGKVFLPMHIPVLLSGFFCGPAVGAIVGAVTPILSSIFTGMPPMMPPMAQMMVFELAIYGALTGLCYQILKWRPIPSLLVAMFGGRLVYGILGYTLLPLLGFNQISILYPLTAGLVTGIPGIILQVILIPSVMHLTERATGYSAGENQTS